MEQYETFVIDAFDFKQEEGRLELKYTLDDNVRFIETFELPAGIEYQPVSLTIVDRAMLALHIAAGTSYYKSCCPRNIEVRSGALSKDHAAFWDNFYLNGLGEFFLQNNIDPTGLVNFPSMESPPLLNLDRPYEEKRILVPLGGGKDSIVTAEILKKAGFDITLLRLSYHPLIDEIVKEADIPVIMMERTLSPALFELNNQGALNGHVPITGILSTLCTVVALLYGFDTIIMSNERSADEANREWKGRKVNHQWSKSFEFEKLFLRYIASFITPDLKYFSLLRHLSELAITKYFCSMPQYFDKVTSCNVNWKIIQEKHGNIPDSGRWCGECPKCASAFCLYAAFLPRDTLIEIFKKNLYEDTTLRILYRELLGVEGFKPFDCVGTSNEVRAAFLLAHQRGDLDSTPIMQMFLKEVLPTIKDPDALIEAELKPGSKHAIPKEFLSAINADK